MALFQGVLLSSRCPCSNLRYCELERETVVDKKLLTIIAAVLLPPLGVYLKKDVGKELLICVVLTILGFLPGVIYALWVVTR